MNRNHRSRKTRALIVEAVESRTLLSTAVPALSERAARIVEAFAIPAIKGFINGTVTGITQLSPNSELVTYSGKGKANIIGDGKGTGQHVITSHLLKNGSSNDTYRQGSAMIRGTTDLVSVQYTGKGRTNPNGSFTATLHGRARSVSGSAAGLSGSFTAQISGSSRTGPFTINFTIKV